MPNDFDSFASVPEMKNLSNHFQIKLFIISICFFYSPFQPKSKHLIRQESSPSIYPTPTSLLRIFPEQTGYKRDGSGTWDFANQFAMHNRLFSELLGTFVNFGKPIQRKMSQISSQNKRI